MVVPRAHGVIAQLTCSAFKPCGVHTRSCGRGCATLAGARSYSAIAEWTSDAPALVRAALGLAGPAPDLVTIWRVLTAVDPAALDRAIGSWVTAQLAGPGPDPVRAVLAVDGKTLRGARAGQDRAPHLMACLDHGSGAVCAQVAVDGKSNEIPMFAPLLDEIPGLAGALVTADALHAQREHASYLHRRGAHYLLTGAWVRTWPRLSSSQGDHQTHDPPRGQAVQLSRRLTSRRQSQRGGWPARSRPGWWSRPEIRSSGVAGRRRVRRSPRRALALARPARRARAVLAEQLPRISNANPADRALRGYRPGWAAQAGLHARIGDPGAPGVIGGTARAVVAYQDTPLMRNAPKLVGMPAGRLCAVSTPAVVRDLAA